jgi:hypothetical protein
MAEIHSHIDVCEDCLFYIANGDMPPDAEPERCGEIRAGVAALPGFVVAGDETYEFSRRPCDCCKSIFAGSRHAAVVFLNPAPPSHVPSRDAFADEED